MRDQWYGDHRDVVKWGILLELARSRTHKHILQILYYRPSNWDSLEIDHQQVELGSEVKNHFRNAKSISTMKCETTIETIEAEFLNRVEYHKLVLEKIRENTRPGSIVLLDPDTGLEPKGKAGLQHVLNQELREIWGSISTGVMLVLYQHKTGRNNEPWIQVKQKQFEDALGVSAKLAYAPGIANDVAFFFAEKN